MSLELLTEREAETVELVAQGLANWQIAAEMGVVEATVKAHVMHAMRKIGAVNRVQLTLEWLFIPWEHH